MKFSSIFRRRKKSKAVKVPKTPTKDVKKSKKASKASRKKSKKSSRKKGKTPSPEQVVPEEEGMEEEAPHSQTVTKDGESVASRGSRQLSGKLKKLFSSSASVGNSITSNRGAYSIAETKAYAKEEEGRPPLSAVSCAVSEAESAKESVTES